MDWTWAGVRKAVMADGDGRREVDINIVIVICHFSTLMLNYILFVQLYTMCVGLPTVFKAVPSTYPADNFTPAKIVFPTTGCDKYQVVCTQVLAIPSTLKLTIFDRARVSLLYGTLFYKLFVYLQT